VRPSNPACLEGIHNEMGENNLKEGTETTESYEVQDHGIS
jgi:hypothetical protein